MIIQNKIFIYINKIFIKFFIFKKSYKKYFLISKSNIMKQLCKDLLSAIY